MNGLPVLLMVLLLAGCGDPFCHLGGECLPCEKPSNLETVLYEDSLDPGWSDTSWYGTKLESVTNKKRCGSASLLVTIVKENGALSLERKAGALALDALDSVSFDIHPGDDANIRFTEQMIVALEQAPPMIEGAYVPLRGKISPGRWSKVTIPIEDLRKSLTEMNRVQMKYQSEDEPPSGGFRFHVDNIKLIRRPPDLGAQPDQ